MCVCRCVWCTYVACVDYLAPGIVGLWQCKHCTVTTCVLHLIIYSCFMCMYIHVHACTFACGCLPAVGQHLSIKHPSPQRSSPPNSSVCVCVCVYWVPARARLWKVHSFCCFCGNWEKVKPISQCRGKLKPSCGELICNMAATKFAHIGRNLGLIDCTLTY